MQTIITGFFVAAVVIGGFLICREIVCWYWKLNEIVELLKAIKEK